VGCGEWGGVRAGVFFYIKKQVLFKKKNQVDLRSF
jgi:hypothetical protein